MPEARPSTAPGEGGEGAEVQGTAPAAPEPLPEAAPGAEATPEAPSAPDAGGAPGTEEAQGDAVMSEEAAATRIQAVQRGRQARARVATLREQPSAALGDSAGGAGGAGAGADAAGGGEAGGEGAAGEGAQGATQGTEGAEGAEGAEEQPALRGPARCTFVIMPEGLTVSHECALTMTVASVKFELAEELRSGDAALSLAYAGVHCSDPAATLADLGLQPGEEAQLELTLEYTALPALKSSGQKDKLDVEVDQGVGMSAKIVEVHIDRSAMEAPRRWLGGYRNKRTGVTYLHGATQTARAATHRVERFTRDTQTATQVARTAQTGRDATTQMARPDLLLDTSGDVEAVPGRYVTSEEWVQVKAAAVLIIQRYARGWFARRLANELRRRREERRDFVAGEEERKRVEAEEQREAEIRRRMHPRTAADFEILYGELDAWRLQETETINEAHAGDEPSRQHALKQLLYKETKLLQTIDRLKITANHENRDRRIAHELSEMGQSKTWEMADGTIVDVVTPYTTRAQELQQLYHGLKLPLLTTDERLDVLLHIKWTVKEWDCSLTREIVDLIDREADLLNRGRNPKSLSGLRQRIANLFLQFIETPEFNPESTRFQLVPQGVAPAEEAAY